MPFIALLKCVPLPSADTYQIQVALFYAAIFFALVKLASTIWYVCQPDATTVMNTLRGRTFYYAGKFSPALFVITLLVREYIQGAPLTEIAILAVVVVAAVAMAIVAIHQRTAGTSFGLIHDIKRGQQQRRKP